MVKVSISVPFFAAVFTVTSTSKLPLTSMGTRLVIEKMKIKFFDSATAQGGVIMSSLKLTVVSELKLVSLPVINRKRGSGIKWEEKAESGMSLMLRVACGGMHPTDT